MSVLSMVLYFTYLFWYNPPYSFGVIGDTQTRWSIARKAYAAMEKEGVENIFHLGDVWGCGSLKRWSQLTSDKWFGPHMTLTHYVIGNHELLRCRNHRYIIGPYRRKWIKHFVWNDRKIPRWWWKNNKYKTYGGRMLGAVYVLLLDSATPDISNHQLKWLKSTFEYYGLKGPRMFMIFSHRGLPCRRCKGRWYRRLDNMPYTWRNIKLWKLLQKYKHRIIAAFHGHWHGYLHYDSDGIKTWCSGGGGGYQPRGQYFHWLKLVMWENMLLRVDIKRIK